MAHSPDGLWAIFFEVINLKMKLKSFLSYVWVAAMASALTFLLVTEPAIPEGYSKLEELKQLIEEKQSVSHLRSRHEQDRGDPPRDLL